MTTTISHRVLYGRDVPPVNLEQVRHGIACGIERQKGRTTYDRHKLMKSSARVLLPALITSISNRISGRNIVPIVAIRRSALPSYPETRGIVRENAS